MDYSGRQYYVIMGTEDNENSEGQTLPIIVPYNTLKPGQTILPHSVTHPVPPKHKPHKK